MLKYKASDIIKRAKDIADLRGTEFVSDEECLSLINESWVDIYNKLINIGDRSFLTKMELSEGDNPLPDDFYSLNFITDEFNKPIPRYTVGMSPYEKFYEIVNDHIQLNRCSKAFMYYYTEPITITFPSSDIKISSGGIGVGNPAFYDRDTGYIYFKGGNFASKHNNFSTVYEGTDGIIPFNAATVIPSIIYVDYDGEQIKTNGSQVNKIYIDGEEWSISITSETSLIVYHRSENEWLVYDYLNDSFSRINTSDNVISNFGKPTTLDEFYEVVDGHMFLENKDGYYLDGALLQKKVNSDNIKTGVVFSVNFDTGYGAFLGDPLTIKSIFPDTELNFPNNVFYSILAYQLAWAFCCKQAKDTKYIEAQLVNAWDTLHNSLSRDGFGQSSIINNYRG